MKPSFSLRHTALLAGLLLLAACSHKEPEAAAPPAAAPLDETFGFMSQIPQDVEAYSAFYNSRKVWQRLVNSKAYAALRASHLFQHHFDRVPGTRKLLDFFSPNAQNAISNPDVLAWRHIAADALGDECFISLANGATQDLQTWQQLLKEFRTQQRIHEIKDIVAPLSGGKPNPSWMPGALPALLPYIQSLQCPPFVAGFKMSSQKAALQDQIDRLRKKLPPSVAITSFNLGDKPFTSWTFVAGSLIPADKQERMRAFLERNVQDKAAADGYLQALLSRKVEAAFGYVGDYFLVSIGPDHSHLKLAASPADSLLHRAELSVLTPYAGKTVWSACWTCQKLLEQASQRDFDLLPAFESIKPSLAASLSQKDIEQIESNLRRIDAKGQSLLHPTIIQPAVAVSYWQDGLRTEQYGGVLPAGLATGKPLTFEPADLPSSFIWAGSQADPAFGPAFLDWLDDLAKTSLDLYHRAVLPNLSGQKRPGFAMAEALVMPRLTDLYHITRDQFLKSLGTESTLSVDLNGAIPALPQIPVPIQQEGRMMRIAVIREVADEKLLAQSWASYLALARQLSVFLPPKMQPSGGLPEPQSKDLGGAEMFFYPLPIDTGDLLPNITISAGKDFIASTSPAYSSEISDALKGAASGGVPSALKIDVRLTAAYDFAERWLNLAGEHPELFFKQKPDAAARFTQNEPKLRSLLKGLRLLQGMEGRVFQENGGLRISIVLHIHDIQ